MKHKKISIADLIAKAKAEPITSENVLKSISGGIGTSGNDANAGKGAKGQKGEAI